MILDSTASTEWPLVSALFITYKRFDHLQNAVMSFLEQTSYPNIEVIISDDGSPPEVQEAIQALPIPKTVILAPKNRGLGANFNQGMSACKGKYILAIQDDWVCHGPADYLSNSVYLLEQYPEIGLIHFTMGLDHIPPEAARQGLNQIAYLYPDDPTLRAYHVIYSDQPHLRRAAINDLLGPYLEHRNMEECERDYEKRWDQQRVYKSAMFPAYWLKVFSNEGIADSLREGRMRNRVDRMLAPLAGRLNKESRLYKIGRSILRSIQQLLGGYRS